MTIGTLKNSKSKGFAHQAWESLIARLQAPRVHDHTHRKQGVDYAFEPIGYEILGHSTHAYMTGEAYGVRRGDRILLNVNHTEQCYKITAIDYYSSPSTMWTALLERIS